MPEHAKNTRRLFFALWPDQRMRHSIVRCRLGLGQVSKRQVPDHNLHLTLLFLGNQPAALLNPLVAAVDSIRLPSFSLTLDRFGWFPRAGVAWLGGDAPAAGLALVQSLESVCGELDIRFDQRLWKPHVTLYRKVMQLPAAAQPKSLEWPVNGFVLVESVPSKPYSVLHRWRLAQSASKIG